MAQDDEIDIRSDGGCRKQIQAAFEILKRAHPEV